MFQNLKAKTQKGFTLIELVIVVVLIGVLSVVMFKIFGNGVSDSAKAQSLYSTSKAIGAEWSMLTLQTGSPSTIAGNPLIGTVLATETPGSTLLKGLMTGSTSNPLFATTFTQNGISKMSSVIRPDYTLHNFPISILDSVPNAMIVSFGSTAAPVSTEIIKTLMDKYGDPACTNLAATCNTGNIRLDSTLVGTVGIVVQL